MARAKVFYNGRSQSIRLPKEFRFEGTEVSIRREGDAVILEPIRMPVWPDGLFETIRIKDPEFQRPLQGEVPGAPQW